MKKGNALYSITHHKCPECNEGDVYPDNNPYNFNQLMKMHETCSSCGHRFEKEPGYFFGAMYVSYGLAVAAGVAIFLMMYVIAAPLSLEIYIAGVGTGIILLTPPLYRLSRMIWMNLFTKYNPKAIHKH